MSILNKLADKISIDRINRLFDRDLPVKKREYTHIPHTIKKTEKDKIHSKYKRWCKIHNITFKDNSNLSYNKKQGKWVKMK